VWDLEAVWRFGEDKNHLVNKNRVNLLCKNTYHIKQKTEDQLFARKEFNLEVNIAKTKYMFMFPNHNSGKILKKRQFYNL